MVRQQILPSSSTDQEPIDYALPSSNQFWPNHGSAVRFGAEVNSYFTKEVEFGAIFPLGHDPAILPPGSSNIPLLTVPKDVTKRRICGDASYPAGVSLNDSISEELCLGSDDKLRLPSIWDLLAHIPVIGPDNALLAKVDWARGYRQIPIDPGDSLRQLFWLPQAGFMIDAKGIFGVKSMAAVQQHLHQAVLAVAHQLQVKPLGQDQPAPEPHQLQTSGEPDQSAYRATLPYIDDGLLVMHKAVAEAFWRNIRAVFKVLNIKISETSSHICPPSQKITMVVECGRRIVKRILDVLRSPVVPGTTLISITPEVAADLNWWLYTGPKLNARAVIQPVHLP